MKPRVKICGLTRAVDVELAVTLGASYVGFVLATDSPRAITASAARVLAAGLSASVQAVLVFRAADVEEVLSAVGESGVRRVQIHDLTELARQALVAAGVTVHRVLAIDPRARALPEFVPPPSASEPGLLDVGRGGSGRTFDWRLLGDAAPAHTFIAGGLTPENLAALLPHRPWGIDLSSGVERAPGIKDHGRLRRLFDLLEQAA